MPQFDHEPPKWALWFLQLYCKPRVREIIEGDAYELFYKRVERDGLKVAKRKFGWDVLRFFRPKYIKGLEDINSLNNIAMFKNYFKISVRSLVRQKFFSIINISGLSLGLAACLLIMLYVTNELSYDNFHKEVDRVYRIAKNQSGQYTPASLGAQSKKDFPEIEEVVRLSGPFEQTFKVDNQIFKEQEGFSADSTFHKIFTVQFLEGNPDKALTAPNTIVLTASLAAKLFPNQEAYGQLLTVNGKPIKVTGVVADPPKNTHFHYNFIESFPHESWITAGNWTGNNFFTYAKLVPGATPASVEAKYPDFMAKYVGPDLVKFTGHADYKAYLADGGRQETFTLKPMKDLHLYYPHMALGSQGNIDNVYIFSAVAFFILLIASINFMNLSTARSAARSKEVGMRKVLGSRRNQLVYQFLVESMMISISAMFLSLGLASLFLEGFNQLANRSFSYTDLLAPDTMGLLLILVFVVGFLAGSYPAFYLSSFQPIKALKGEVKSNGGNVFLRKGLVAFQFAISIFLIISTMVVFSQLRFMGKQKLGFQPEQIMVVKNTSLLGEKINAFKNQLLQKPNIASLTLTNQYVSNNIADWGYSTMEDNRRSFNLMNIFTTDDFLETMGLELAEGRFYSNNLASDSVAVVINESTKRALGFENVLGEKLSRGEGEDYTIVGVVKDFNYVSLKRSIAPLILRRMSEDGHMEGGWYGGDYLLLNVTGNFAETVNQVADEWNAMALDEPFDYVFLDNAFNSLYEEERRFGKLFTASSGLAIAIACLGLFALAAFTLERRHKEIAVRKVLGASVKNLCMLVVSDFTKLVFIGAVFAIPVGYWIMQDWLATFSYQININNPLLFILPVLLVAIVALLTVGFQSVKTAIGNPIKALRSE
ncbi:ABC transporter permease [Roseivirga echinicomitans]